MGAGIRPALVEQSSLAKLGDPLQIARSQDFAHWMSKILHTFPARLDGAVC